MEFDLKQFVDEHFKGVKSDVAKEFNVSPQAVGHWFRLGISPQRAAQLELWALKKKA